MTWPVVGVVTALGVTTFLGLIAPAVADRIRYGKQERKGG